MYKLDDLEVDPGMPELLVSEATDVSGLDLLGLRAPAEAVANWLMNGVTTVTPAIRYFSLRCWLIHRYLDLGGIKNWSAFSAFAAKVEAAIAYASQLVDDHTQGVVGRNGAAAAVSQANGVFPLRPLTKILAVEVYAGPSEALGLGESASAVPTLTIERGVPLARSFGTLLEKDNVLTTISAADEHQLVDRAQLVKLGHGFTMARPSALECQVLIDAIMPKAPREGTLQLELHRIASYCLLLYLSEALGREITEVDVFAAVSQHKLTEIPEELHSTCDGWVQFAVRDLLVLTHEAAVSNVLRQLSQVPGSEKRQSAQEVISALVSQNLDSGLSGLNVNVPAEQPICDLYEAVLAALDETVEVRGLRRWSGSLSEPLLFEKASWLKAAEGLGLLPVSWIISARPLEPGIRGNLPGFQFDTQAGIYRIGVGAVVLPEVNAWRTSSKPIREVTAWLIQRSVDQHLRIAWSRLAREPYKDVGLIRSDGDDWVYQKDFYAGRATSRIYQAINWLRQLSLIDETGITPAGSELLQSGLATLRRRSDKPK